MTKGQLVEKLSIYPDDAVIQIVVNGKVSNINDIDEGEDAKTLETTTLFLCDKEVTDEYFETFENAN